jgi:hypothetical protein
MAPACAQARTLFSANAVIKINGAGYPLAHMRQKVQAAHGGHLDIRNDTGRSVRVDRLQELLDRLKCMDRVSMRAEKIVDRGARRMHRRQ